MTLADERYRAVRWAREFLYDLLDPKKTPKVPRDVRIRARAVLKHYPADYEMHRVALLVPSSFERDDEE